MAKSLLEQLPTIVAEGKREAERVMERAESNFRLGLQTRELVIPSKDSKWQGLFNNKDENFADNSKLPGSCLIYGDNMLAIAAILSGNDVEASMRGKVDLIYIDPPYDSRANYTTEVKLGIGVIQQKPTVIEQYAYSDTWKEGSKSYLESIVPRLYLMKELLSDYGSLWVHLDWHVGHYVRVVLDEIFGKENFRNEVIWKSASGHSDAELMGTTHNTIFVYSKGPQVILRDIFKKRTPMVVVLKILT